MKPSNTEDQENQAEVNEGTLEFQFIPGRHVYKQEGPYLVCRECELHHAVYIGMDKIMVGEDESGSPIVRSRSELNLAS